MAYINAEFAVEEKLWFEIQQPLLLWMCRHEQGRKLLCMDQTLERIDIIRPNSVSMYLGDGKMRTDFRTHSKWAKLIRGQWNWFQNIAEEYAFFQRLGKVPFISEPVVAMKATSSTFYPAAGAVSPCDGYASAANLAVTWTTIVNHAGVYGSATTSLSHGMYIRSGTSSNKWREMHRSLFLFDTSGLGGDTIDSSTLSLYGESKVDSFAAMLPEMNIFSSSPASASTIVPGDYNSLGTTEFSTGISYSSFSVVGYNDFSLNASGLTAVNGSGISKFGSRDAVYDATDTSPAWENNEIMSVRIYLADQAGTANDPKLVVEHTLAEMFRPNMFLMQAVNRASRF